MQKLKTLLSSGRKTGPAAAVLAAAGLLLSACGPLNPTAPITPGYQPVVPGHTATQAPATGGTDNTPAAPRGFDATVRIGDCSGSIIRLPDSQPTDKALILTNGHCDHRTETQGGTSAERPSRVKVTLLSGPQAARIGQFTTDSLVYATMDTTDIALYRAPKTYEQLRLHYGITPYQLDTSGPAVGDKIRIPSGYWRKQFSCDVNAIVPTVREQSWHWDNAIRFSGLQCPTQNGTSGSPMINPSTGLIVGVNNSGNFSNSCSYESPCDMNDKGELTMVAHARYGAQTAMIPQCFDRSGFVGGAQCPLPQPQRF